IPVVGRRPMEEVMGGKEAPPVVVPYYSREAKKGHEPSAELSPYRNTPEQAEKLAAKLGQEQHPGDYERLQKKINVLKKEELSEAEKKNLEKNLQAYNGKNKADLNLSAFREQEIQRLEKLAALIPETERGKGRYDHVLERLQDVK
ncbi:hypothetical protein COT68_03300, partial [bacterium (Candidatus Torokbacteria) CG09_land_8_20_14_0_10_42_11]